LWPAARRSIPYGLFPIAGILLLTAASMAAGAAGAEGVGFSAIYLLLLLALLVLAAVLMVRKPQWVDPTGTRRDRRKNGTLPTSRPGRSPR
jgi:hypothetical protein